LDRKSAASDAMAGDAPAVRKLSYNEQRELDRLPAEIESLETRLAELEGEISASDFYTQDHEVTKPVLDAFTTTQQALDQALERWTELEDRVRAYQQGRAK
jgi:ATP-binding cassette subfamily F protein uup